MMKTKKPLFITIANQKGGCGKSTLTLNLALGFKILGYSVAIIDTDNQGSLQTWSRLTEDTIDIFFSNYDLTKDDLKPLQTYDLIFIDTPPRLDESNLKNLALSDFVLIPTVPANFDLWAIENTLKLISLAKKSKKTLKPYFLINLLPPNKSCFMEDLDNVLTNQFKKCSVLNSVLKRRNAYIIEPKKNVFSRKDFRAKAELKALILELENIFKSR